MKKSVLTIIVVCASFNAKAQDFILIDNTPRSSAMGGTGVSASASAMSLYDNTASIALGSNRGAISYAYSPYMWDKLSGNNLHTLAGFYKINQRHGVAAGVRYFNKGNSMLLDGEGQITGISKPYDFSLDLGYSYRINDLMGVSANIRYIVVNPDAYGMEKGNAFGFDLGYYFSKERWSAGVALSNVGTSINYGGDDYDTPGWVKAGVSYRQPFASDHCLVGSAQFDYLFQPSPSKGYVIGVGLEYGYRERYFLRGGYRLAENVMDYNYGSIGAGIKISCVNLSLSYLFSIEDSPINKTLMMSLGVAF